MLHVCCVSYVFLSLKILHFQMNDIMLYTYPQQDCKFRLINRLPLAGMEVGMTTFMEIYTVQ